MIRPEPYRDRTGRHQAATHHATTNGRVGPCPGRDFDCLLRFRQLLRTSSCVGGDSGDMNSTRKMDLPGDSGDSRMRLARLLILLITFGPCPHQWMLLLASASTPVRSASEVASSASRCDDCPECRRPEKSVPPAPPACSCVKLNFIVQASVELPDGQDVAPLFERFPLLLGSAGGNCNLQIRGWPPLAAVALSGGELPLRI